MISNTTPIIGLPMTKNKLSDRCPICNSPEVVSQTPRTTYSCGSSDYDQRPGTFKQSTRCKFPSNVYGSYRDFTEERLGAHIESQWTRPDHFAHCNYQRGHLPQLCIIAS